MQRVRKFKIEELSKGQLLLAWCVLIGTFALFLFIAGVFAPQEVFQRHCKRWYKGDMDHLDSPVAPIDFMIKRDAILHESPYFTNWNQNFFFTMNIYRRPKFSKSEVPPPPSEQGPGWLSRLKEALARGKIVMRVEFPEVRGRGREPGGGGDVEGYVGL